MAVTQEQIDAGRKLHDMYQSGEISQADFDKRSKALTGLINSPKETTSTPSSTNYQGGTPTTLKAPTEGQEKPKTDGYYGKPGTINVAEPTKDGQPDYNLDSEQRQKEIVNNLTTYKNTNPELFRDRATYDSMFHYADRDATQKKILDDYFNQVQRERATTIAADAGQGKNLSNSDLEVLKQNNPDAYNTYMANIKNQSIIDSVTGGNDIMSNYSATIQALIDARYNKEDESSKEIYDRFMDTDAINASKDELRRKAEAIENLQSQMKDMEGEIRKQLGAGASEGYIRARAAKANKELQNELDGLINDYDSARGALQDKIETAQTNYQLYLQDKQLQDKKDDAYLQAELGLTKEVFDKSWNMMLRDLDKQDKLEMNKLSLLEKMDLSNLSDETLNKIGTSNYLKEILKFKRSLDKDARLAVVGDTTIAYDDFGQVLGSINPTQDVFTNYTPVTQENINKGIDELKYNYNYRVGTKLKRGECGEFVNDWLNTVGIPGHIVTNTWDEKKAIRNSNTPKVGSIAIVKSSTHPDNGHVAIVMGVKPNGDVVVRESNWNGDHTIHERTLKASDMYGYFDPTKQVVEKKKDKGYVESRREIYKDMIDNYNAAKSYSKELGVPVGQLKDEQRKWMIEKQKPATSEALSELDKLLSAGRNRAGRLWSFTRLSGSDSDFYHAYKYIKDNLTMDKLVDLKSSGATFGALSDSERVAIGNAASKLNLSLSTSEFKEQLGIIAANLLRAMGGEDPRTGKKYTEEQLQEFGTIFRNAFTDKKDINKDFN